jgi:osmotically-inducible protein OsmY
MKETFMKRIVYVIAATLAATTLASCGSRDPAQPAAPKQQSGALSGGTARPADNFQSSVAPKNAPVATPAADRELSNKVKNALTTSNGVEIGAVDVAAADGVVTINGTVQMPAEKDRAALLALGIDGVRSVVNNLVVIRGS